MTYNFHVFEEFFWFFLVMFGAQAVDYLQNFDPSTVTDWRRWIASAMIAAIRTLIGALLSWRTRAATS